MVDPSAADPEADERHSSAEPRDVCGSLSDWICIGAQAVYNLFLGLRHCRLLVVLQRIRKLFILNDCVQLWIRRLSQC